jgi:hypothetical protein
MVSEFLQVCLTFLLVLTSQITNTSNVVACSMTNLNFVNKLIVCFKLSFIECLNVIAQTIFKQDAIHTKQALYIVYWVLFEFGTFCKKAIALLYHLIFHAIVPVALLQVLWQAGCYVKCRIRYSCTE